MLPSPQEAPNWSIWPSTHCLRSLPAGSRSRSLGLPLLTLWAPLHMDSVTPHCVPVAMATRSWYFQRLQWIWRLQESQKPSPMEYSPRIWWHNLLGIPPLPVISMAPHPSHCPQRLILCACLYGTEVLGHVIICLLLLHLMKMSLRKGLGLHFLPLKTWRIKRSFS